MKTLERKIILDDQTAEFLDVLERLYICHAAYVLHKARNVFNATYADWWSLAGSKWAEILED